MTGKSHTPRIRIPRSKLDDLQSTAQDVKHLSDKPNQHASVGYGKPPFEHRFKPGKSGNPKGRPKGAKNESTLWREILHKKIPNQKTGRSISVLNGILLKITEGALRGDLKSATFALNRYAAMVSGDIAPTDLSEDDREVLEAFARRRMAQPER